MGVRKRQEPSTFPDAWYPPSARLTQNQWVPWLGLIIDGTCFLGSWLDCPLLAIQLVLACVSVSSREDGTLPGRMLDIWEARQARVSLGAYCFCVPLYKVFACLFVMFLFFPKQGFSM